MKFEIIIPEIVVHIAGWAFVAIAVSTVLTLYAKWAVVKLDDARIASHFYLWMICKNKRHRNVAAFRSWIRQLREDGDTETEKALEDVFKYK